MKKTNFVKIGTGICLSALLLMTTGCIEETFPTSIATEDQLASSNMATEAMVNGIPSSLNGSVFGFSAGYHFDWGYGSMMHIRDVMTEDMAITSSGYDWYTAWEYNQYIGESYLATQVIWNHFTGDVTMPNKIIGAIDYDEASETQKGFLAVAHAWRAFFYLDMARMYEFLENDKTVGEKVLHLTVPITTAETTEDESRNNPRVTREVMAAFILDDLDFAEANIEYYTNKAQTMPHLDVVYGLKARLYMWIEDYPNAQKYARLAIDASSTAPMTETQCLDTKTGFNTLSCWMWGSQLVSDDDAVQSAILNWTSWASNETSFGYSGAGPYVMAGKSFYERINDTDFRKKMWKAPEGHPLSGKETFLVSEASGDFRDVLPAYASLKFRPNEGNCDEYTTGSASAYPLMRVEEMYFIEAEAAAHNGGDALSLLTDFMTTYRDPAYVCKKTGDDLIEEIVFQKRVELWGEGQSFFDIKRLNYSVTRGYEGTNFSEEARFNTEGRPAWMNICIVQSEKNNNSALVGFENPDPSDLYDAWIE